jgi:predicted nucleotidyltransferase
MGVELISVSGEHESDGRHTPQAQMPSSDPSECPRDCDIPVVPWLDKATAALVRATVAIVARRHPDLLAVVLFGSVARHDERPLDDPHPSDVDLLLLFDLEPELDRLPFERRQEVFHSLGLALRQHMDAPREVNAMPVVRDLADWDELFVENVARDGLLLWARGPLPEPLAAVEARTWPPSPAVQSGEEATRPQVG